MEKENSVQNSALNIVQKEQEKLINSKKIKRKKLGELEVLW